MARGMRWDRAARRERRHTAHEADLADARARAYGAYDPSAPMSVDQRVSIKRLCRETGTDFETDGCGLTQEGAHEMIEYLREVRRTNGGA